jgi:hypothetical protein
MAPSGGPPQEGTLKIPQRATSRRPLWGPLRGNPSGESSGLTLSVGPPRGKPQREIPWGGPTLSILRGDALTDIGDPSGGSRRGTPSGAPRGTHSTDPSIEPLKGTASSAPPLVGRLKGNPQSEPLKRFLSMGAPQLDQLKATPSRDLPRGNPRDDPLNWSNSRGPLSGPPQGYPKWHSQVAPSGGPFNGTSSGTPLVNLSREPLPADPVQVTISSGSLHWNPSNGPLPGDIHLTPSTGRPMFPLLIAIRAELYGRPSRATLKEPSLCRPPLGDINKGILSLAALQWDNE